MGATASIAFRVLELKLSRRSLTEAEEREGASEKASMNRVLVVSLMWRFLMVFDRVRAIGVILSSRKIQRWSDRATSLAERNDDSKPLVINKSRVWPRL